MHAQRRVDYSQVYNVSLYIRPITANESTCTHALDEVRGVANEVK